MIMSPIHVAARLCYAYQHGYVIMDKIAYSMCIGQQISNFGNLKPIFMETGKFFTGISQWGVYVCI